MKKLNLPPLLPGLAIGLAIMIFSWPISAATNDVQTRFDLLTIKGKTYTNVTVTSRETDYIFIVHAGGMESIKLVDLPFDLRRTLGYRSAPAKDNSIGTYIDFSRMDLFHRRGSETNSTAVSSTRADSRLTLWLARWEPAWVRELRLKYLPRPSDATGVSLLAASTAVAVLLYVFFGYCCRLLCLKAGKQPGALVWIPLLQFIPLLQAAGMSLWWFLLCFLPVINLAVWIVWSFRIVKARGRSPVLTLMLLLPFVNMIAFLYLAFAKAEAPAAAKPKGPSKTIPLRSF